MHVHVAHGMAYTHTTRHDMTRALRAHTHTRNYTDRKCRPHSVYRSFLIGWVPLIHFSISVFLAFLHSKNDEGEYHDHIKYPRSGPQPYSDYLLTFVQKKVKATPKADKASAQSAAAEPAVVGKPEKAQAVFMEGQLIRSIDQVSRTLRLL